MSELTFFWHDYETFGAVPRRDRPAQFAGLRTDADLNPIDAPVMCHCRPAPDFLPEPEACLLTGILPQECLEKGLPEHAFAEAIERQLAKPGTVGVGYNSIRFDDEVTRFLFWRNLIDPYAREWQNQCGRWDLLDVLRCAYALRPDGIEWPRHEDGRASFKLEHFTRANGLDHDSAHDALSDVRATLALARLLKARQPKLWEFCLRLRKKDAVLDEIASAQSQGRPFLHVSGMYGTERGCLAVVWPLAPHPTNRNEIIVWDLAQDPAELAQLGIDSLRQRMFSRADELPDGVTRLPIKTIHINKSPVVIANLKTLTPAMAQRWGIDLDQALRHADVAARHAGKLAGMWPEVFERAAARAARRCRRGPVWRLRRQRGSAHAAAAARLEPAGAGRQAAGLRRPAAGRTAVPIPRAQLPRHVERGRTCAMAGALRRPAVRREALGRLGLRAFAERLAALEDGADERCAPAAGRAARLRGAASLRIVLPAQRRS